MFREGNFVFSENESGESTILASCIPKVIIEKLKEDIITPTYASEGDSGMDVYAVDDLIILPGTATSMGLGFKLLIPKHPLHDFGYRWELQVRPRSGISARTLMTVILGSVDNLYRGEVGVIIHNTNALQYHQNKETKVIHITSDYPLSLKGEKDPDFPFDNELPEGTYIIRKGEKFAQLVFNEVIRPLEMEIGVVDETDRGDKGFGSTGIR